jgi:tRNA pseudouridine38-40 synthase
VHVKIVLCYSGTDFSGFAAQRGRRTVQGELEAALTKYAKTPVAVVAAGRTDAGVHAHGQVVGFLLPPHLSRLAADDAVNFCNYLVQDLNAILPEDIEIKSAELLEKFNARQASSAKTYVYNCTYKDRGDPERLFLTKRPNLDLMRRAAQALVGTHDFFNLSNETERTPKTTRTVYKIEIREKGEKLTFTVRGNAFLKNMVRLIVGTLLAVGNRKIPPESMNAILTGPTRQTTCAPAHGLTLFSVEF